MCLAREARQADRLRCPGGAHSPRAPGDGPTVLGLKRFGFHSQPTTLQLTFDKPLDPTTAQDVGNYRITGPSGSRVRIASVSYDPIALTVTISPRGRLDLHHTYRLTVVGTPPTGVTDTAGNLLDGALTGHPGSNFVTTLTARNLVPAGPRPPARRTVHGR